MLDKLEKTCADISGKEVCEYLIGKGLPWCVTSIYDWWFDGEVYVKLNEPATLKGLATFDFSASLWGDGIGGVAVFETDRVLLESLYIEWNGAVLTLRVRSLNGGSERVDIHTFPDFAVATVLMSRDLSSRIIDSLNRSGYSEVAEFFRRGAELYSSSGGRGDLKKVYVRDPDSDIYGNTRVANTVVVGDLPLQGSSPGSGGPLELLLVLIDAGSRPYDRYPYRVKLRFSDAKFKKRSHPYSIVSSCSIDRDLVSWNRGGYELVDRYVLAGVKGISRFMNAVAVARSL